MAVTLSVSSTDLSDDRIQDMTLNLYRTIGKETDIEAELPKGSAEKGARGEPITLGLIILTFISSGSAVALFKVLEPYFKRESSLEVNIQREDGAKMVLNARNMKSDQIEKTFNKAKEIFEKSE